MKQMNGTFTLSFVEEDNKQRVIFRVVPLSTREGATFRNNRELFPDEGSLRVVPDKREQSTFKERMRAMGALCVVDLTGSEGKELVKIRQNKNYDPSQGEMNQYAIYSDVIHEFAPGTVFEVIDGSEDAARPAPEACLTPEVLLLVSKVLYGPVPSESLAAADITSLKPFGNDRFLLHTVEIPLQQSHTLYWNPDELINWRQRRGSLRRKGDRPRQEYEDAPRAEGATEEDTTVDEQSTGAQISLDSPVVPLIDTDAAFQKEAVSEGFFAQEEIDLPLPIGSKLSILEPEISFDDHISRLDQPVSENANRLAGKQPTMKLLDLQDPSVRYAGTPLVRDALSKPRIISRTEPLHQVVEQQLKASYDERMGGELKSTQFDRVENPVENLLLALDHAWQEPETRTQSVNALADNEGFVARLMETLRNREQDMSLAAAARARMQEMEAERFHILLELDTAKAERKQYQEELLASASQRKREELDRLTQDVQTLEEKKQALEAVAQSMAMDAQGTAHTLLAERLTCLGGIAEDKVLISPLLGKHHSVQDMVSCVHGRMHARGFTISEDDVLSLLIVFSQFSALGLHAQELGTAQLFAVTLLEALGLQSVSSTVRPGVMVDVVSLLPEDEKRTPTVTLQIFPTDALSLFGHRTLFLLDADLFETVENQQMVPIITVPAMHPLGLADGSALPALPAPASLSSFLELSADATPLLAEEEKWFSQCKETLSHLHVALPDTALLSMRRFVAVATQKSRGGFLYAVDRAMDQWVVPQLIASHVAEDQIQQVLLGLPRSLESARTYLAH